MIKTIEELYKFLDNCVFKAVVKDCTASCKLSLRTVRFEDYFSKPFSETIDIISVKYCQQLAVDRSFGYFDISSSTSFYGRSIYYPNTKVLHKGGIFFFDNKHREPLLTELCRIRKEELDNILCNLRYTEGNFECLMKVIANDN